MLLRKLSNSDLQKFEFIKKNNSFELSEEQKNSLKLMNEVNEKFRVHVLQGTTGSGKTMVYFEALKD